MMSEANVVLQRTSSTEITWALAGLLGKFSDRSQMIGFPNLYHGVSVLQNTEEPDIHRFTLRTPDALEINVEIDYRALSREYIDGLIYRVRRTLAEARQKRDAVSMPINTLSGAVKGALH